MPKVRKPRAHNEDNEAVALIQWRDTYARKYPDLGLLIAIPNGGKRNAREAARLKRMGVRAGVSDYLLPVFHSYPDRTTHGEHLSSSGLWIELKVGKNKLTPAQQEWIMHMGLQRFGTCIAYGWIEAARAIAAYLGLPKGIAP